MMQKIFSINGMINRFLIAFWKLLGLNLLFILTSIPVVTIGPSLVALYTVVFRIVQKKDNHVLREYLIEFKLRWVRGLEFSVVFLSLIGSLGLLIYKFLQRYQILIISFAWMLLLAIFILYGISVFLELTGDLKLGWGFIFKHALNYLMNNIVIVILIFIGIIFTIIFPFMFFRLIIFWLSIGVSGITLINCQLITHYSVIN